MPKPNRQPNPATRQPYSHSTGCANSYYRVVVERHSLKNGHGQTTFCTAHSTHSVVLLFHSTLTLSLSQFLFHSFRFCSVLFRFIPNHHGIVRCCRRRPQASHSTSFNDSGCNDCGSFQIDRLDSRSGTFGFMIGLCCVRLADDHLTTHESLDFSSSDYKYWNHRSRRSWQIDSC